MALVVNKDGTISDVQTIPRTKQDLQDELLGINNQVVTTPAATDRSVSKLAARKAEIEAVLEIMKK